MKIRCFRKIIYFTDTYNLKKSLFYAFAFDVRNFKFKLKLCKFSKIL